MNKANDLFKLFDKYKDYYDLTDIIKEINYILSRNDINNQEFVYKIQEYRSKYPIEMKVLDVRDRMIDFMNIQRVRVSNKELLINTLVSIAGVKILEKIGKEYKPTDIKDYDYIIDTINDDRNK